MQVMCIFRAPGLTRKNYEDVRTYLNWEEHPPAGGLAHFVSFHKGGLVEMDLWQSEKAFRAYFKSSLEPALTRFRLSLPEPEILPVHNMAFAEAVEPRVLHPGSDAAEAHAH